MTTGKPIALVVGAGGGIGGETAAALVRHGWHVRGLARRPISEPSSVEWLIGDAMSPSDVLDAAAGASLIVHAANPGGYRNWGQVVLPMLNNSIEAARTNGARLVLPGTIYNYGPDAFPLIREDAPQFPVSLKGAIRREMEDRLEWASRDGLRVLIVRAGNFFGPKPGNSWFQEGLIRPGVVPKRVWDPSAPGTTHAWAYLPDVAETIAMLGDRDDLEDFERVHFSGHQLSTAEMAAAIGTALARDPLPTRRFPWIAIRALSPFVSLFREMSEMRYLWNSTIALDDRRLRELLGSAVPATPLIDAVAESLRRLNCLPSAAASSAEPRNPSAIAREARA